MLLPFLQTDKVGWQPESGYPSPDAGAWLAAIVENSDDAILSKTLDGVISTWNRGATSLFGYSVEEAVGRHITIIIPEDRLAEEDEIISRLRKGERIRHFETVRRRKDGRLVDISLTVSPVRDAHGRIIGASKIARDITETRRAAERQTLLLREMNHRIKNLFALISGLVNLTARTATSVAQLTKELSDRVHALARAHDLTLPDLNQEPHQPEATLKGVLRAILAPYASIPSSIVRIEGEDVSVAARSLTSLALLFHELATNAAKYGALSSTGTGLNICINVSASQVIVSWAEESSGAPPPPPERSGFGSHLEKASIRGLGGSVERDWSSDGLHVRISIPLDYLQA
jgi:PAS domain S-box-containing protein